MKNRRILYVLAVLITLAASVTAIILMLNPSYNVKPKEYSYIVISTYPHDKNAFTQGLLFDDGVLYESTGLYGSSSIRRIKLETGEVLQTHELPSQYFGEGITVFDNKIIQLTWQSNKGFVYDKASFELLQTFDYLTEGWGIACDGSRLIMSDGTSNLYFLNTETFQRMGQIEVYDTGGPVDRLNELEYVEGYVYANVWLEEKIAIINPQTGQVEGWINMKGLQNKENQDLNDVFNGIAYDSKAERLFVTGKRWPQLFEIKIIT
jgi:glutamine cyclotransferase